jgi:hypothetical protein
VSPEEKRSRIRDLMESMDGSQAAEFMSWASPRLTWYADAGIQHSETQLDEIIAKLEEIKGKG